jgi:hypothetical protein
MALLARYLAGNRTLRRLTLIGNDMTAEGAAALYAGLATNPTLLDLYTYDNYISEDEHAALERRVARNAAFADFHPSVQTTLQCVKRRAELDVLPLEIWDLIMIRFVLPLFTPDHNCV